MTDPINVDTILFRTLSPKEEAEFRLYAQVNDPEHMERWHLYHPVCRAEWMKRGISPTTHKE
jgi:hypothetical protein